MNLLSRLIACGLLALFSFAPFTATIATDECATATGEPIQLGAIFPQDALFAAENSDYLKGIEAMRQAVNACGGVNGRPVEWLYQPAADREAADAAARQLITENNVPVIVGSGLLAVNEGGRAAAEALGAVYWEVTEAADPGGEWYFSIRPNNRQLGEATGRFVTEVLPAALGKNELNVALIYENRPRGQSIAQGILDALPQSPAIVHDYSDYLTGIRRLGVELREEKIDAVILAAFEEDGDYLWYGAREANANVGAWIHIGGEGYRRGMCERLGNVDGLISVDATGAVNLKNREARLGEIYEHYRRSYLAEHSREPSELADLAASGVFMLLRYVLPEADGNYTAENIRAVIRSLDHDEPLGMMDEGISFRESESDNWSAAVLLQQAQGGAFCTVWPSAAATCLGGIQPFPTWRERALAEERQTCDTPV